MWRGGGEVMGNTAGRQYSGPTRRDAPAGMARGAPPPSFNPDTLAPRVHPSAASAPAAFAGNIHPLPQPQHPLQTNQQTARNKGFKPRSAFPGWRLDAGVERPTRTGAPPAILLTPGAVATRSLRPSRSSRAASPGRAAALTAGATQPPAGGWVGVRKIVFLSFFGGGRR